MDKKKYLTFVIEKEICDLKKGFSLIDSLGDDDLNDILKTDSRVGIKSRFKNKFKFF